MKRFILLFLFVACSISVWAQRIGGIRVDSPQYPVIVYINNEQVCEPVNSFFMANLGRGSYYVEIFAVESVYRGRVNKVKVLAKRVMYNGMGVFSIFAPQRPGFGDCDICDDEFNGGYSDNIMSGGAFERFYSTLRKESFDSHRAKQVTTAVKTGIRFTSEQIRQIIRLFSFESDKLQMLKTLYPALGDKQNAISLCDLLTFSNNRDSYLTFIENYMEDIHRR